MNRPPIPANIKLLLRQEAGFGCCKCGSPIIEYHHIIPWEKEQHFRKKDMMCLCPTHHAEIRVVKESKQRAIKANPINKMEGKVKGGELQVDQEVPIAILGGATFKKQGTLLEIDNEAIISLKVGEDGDLMISLKLYDEAGKKILEIVDNEWESGDYLTWDIENKCNYLKLRHKERDIVLKIDASKTPIEIFGSLWFNGQNFLLEPSRLIFDGVVKQTKIVNCEFVNLCLAVDTREKVLKIKAE